MFLAFKLVYAPLAIRHHFILYRILIRYRRMDLNKHCY